MFLPLSHEDMRGRRWPYVTIGIIVLNTLIFLFTHGAMESRQDAYEEKTREAFQYYVAHPYLKPGPPLDKVLEKVSQSSRKDRLELEALKAVHEEEANARGGVDEATKAEEQAELDKLCAAMAGSQQESPVMKYGYVPGENNFVGLITSQFLHAGWLHLIFNMWFFWLCGCNIEDRWGRFLFPVFYLSAGVVAALTQKATAPASMVPMIGASGAIAGAMGAFLIKFAKTRIRILYFLGLRPRTFIAPAYVMLPLWLLVQVFYGLMVRGTEAGVAFWAHAGGFVYGVAFALVLPLTGLEQKIHKAIEGQISLEQAPEIVEADQLIDAGNHQGAIEILEKFAVKAPTNVDAQLGLLRAAKAGQDAQRETRAYIRLIGLYMQQDAPDSALDLYQEMQGMGLESSVPPALRLRLAKQMEKTEQLERAGQEYSSIHKQGPSDAAAFQALLAHANLMLRMKRKREALSLFTLAQNSPVPHLEWDATITHGLKQAQALPD